MLCELPAGTLQMSEVLGISRKASIEEFRTFLKVMEVYGCGYDNDVDSVKYNRRNEESHS